MKKKSAIIICSVLVVAALAAMIVFVFAGNDEPSVPAFDMTGKWEVCAFKQGESITLLDGQHMVFADGNVTFYSAEADPAQSTYEIAEDGKLYAPQLSKEFVFDKKSDNCVHLHSSQDTSMILVRCDLADTVHTPDKQSLVGNWNVTNRMPEMMEFSETEVKDYRNNETTPSVSSAYTWEADALIYVDVLNTRYEFHQVDENNIVFIDISNGFNLDLQRCE